MKIFLFTVHATLEKSDEILFIILGAILLLGIISILMKLQSNNPVVTAVWKRTRDASLWAGILGALWGGMRYLAVPYLGTRFVAILILLCYAAWFVYFLMYLVR